MQKLVVFAHSFLAPVVNPDSMPRTVFQTLADGFLHHEYFEFPEYTQHTFSATDILGTAKGFRENISHRHYIYDNIDFGSVTDLVLGWHPDVYPDSMKFWSDKGAYRTWIAVPWMPNPMQNSEYLDAYDGMLIDKIMPTCSNYNILPYGAVAYELIRQDIPLETLFEDIGGHPKNHLSELCLQYVRQQIMGIRPQNSILISRITKKYSEILQGNQ